MKHYSSGSEVKRFGSQRAELLSFWHMLEYKNFQVDSAFCYERPMEQ